MTARRPDADVLPAARRARSVLPRAGATRVRVRARCVAAIAAAIALCVTLVTAPRPAGATPIGDPEGTYWATDVDDAGTYPVPQGGGPLTPDNETCLSTPGNDDVFGPISIEDANAAAWTFDYYGTAYGSVYIGVNGLFSFDTVGTLGPTNRCPLDGTLNGVMGLWDDLDPTGTGTICYGTYGTNPGTRVFIVSWTDIGHHALVAQTDSKVTFQIQLYEQDGAIEVLFTDVIFEDGDGSFDLGRSATVGIEGDHPNRYITYSCDVAALSASHAVRFQECWEQDGDGYYDEDCGEDDCDDTDSSIYPGADEFCDGVDNDCDGTLDNDYAVDADTWYRDQDGDGYGDSQHSTTSCTQPQGYVADATDCNDNNAARHPGADEYCNGFDDDCDQLVDEDEAVDASTWYEDYDGDGYGNPNSTDIDCDQPSGYVSDNTDCDDTDSGNYPGADEYCDGEDNDCDNDVDEDAALDVLTWYLDSDSDGYGNPQSTDIDCYQPSGYVADSTDCDDGDGAVYPGADEYCNGYDDDCDNDVDEDEAVDVLTWYRDSDSDGYGNSLVSTIDCDPVTGYVADNTDCNDANQNVNPGEPERCGNYVDDDCDGGIDDEQDAVACTNYFYDLDGDSYGVTGDFECWCAAQGVYRAVVDNDCNDSDASIHPGQGEVCDGEDTNCDGTLPGNEQDADADGTASCEGDCDDSDAAYNIDDVDNDGYSTCGDDGVAGTNDDDCDDGDFDIYPGAPETCNNVDDDCDGQIDNDITILDFYIDADGDGFGDVNDTNPIQDCQAITGYALQNTDCDDGDAAINPGEDEVCNGVDDDCDGGVDDLEDLQGCFDYSLDVDGDDWGVIGDSLCLCDPSGDYRGLAEGDCNDGDSGINPAATEIADGIDNDCDGLIDEGSLADAVVITEVMADPLAVGDEYGEWFEIFNSSATAINLVGLLVYDNYGEQFEVTTDLWIGASDYAVFGVNPYYNQNGGVNVDYEYDWADFELTNFADTIILEHDLEILDQIQYGGGAWPNPFGASMSLDPTMWTPDANDDGAHWCETWNQFAYEMAFGDFGTPGEVNPSCCPDDDDDGYRDAACHPDADCDDGNDAVNPGRAEITCNGWDDDCDPATLDEPDDDGDGYTLCDDCDDTEFSVNPGSAEACNGVDDDCDGDVDEPDANGCTVYFRDNDLDGFGQDGDSRCLCTASAPYDTELDGDCDDTEPAVNPTATEVACDFIDNDCDGNRHPDEVDNDVDGFSECEGDTDDTDPAINPDAGETPCDYIDNNGDGNLHSAEIDDDGDGFDECGPDLQVLSGDDDCDDTDDTVYPGAPDICDGVDDNDCDGVVDPLESDDDGDGASECEGDTDDGDATLNTNDEDFDGITSIDGDCNDNNAEVYPGAPDICDFISDNDCDGVTDPQEDDGEADGFSECAGDCDDADPTVYPGAPDICDGIADNDCDGVIDVLEEDGDGDGYSDCDGDCFDEDELLNLDDLDADGFSTCDDDCDDTEPLSAPGLLETCELGDQIDSDCDGDVNTYGHVECTGNPGEDWCFDAQGQLDPSFIVYYRDQDGDGYGNDLYKRYLCEPEDGYSSQPGDCRDDDPNTFPQAEEVCDNLDNNCNGQADESLEGEAPEGCILLYLDKDGDGFGNADGERCLCAAFGVVEESCPTQASTSYLYENDCFVNNSTDCDDSDLYIHPWIEVDEEWNEIAIPHELLDGADNDCSGDIPVVELDCDDDRHLAALPAGVEFNEEILYRDSNTLLDINVLEETGELEGCSPGSFETIDCWDSIVDIECDDYGLWVLSLASAEDKFIKAKRTPAPVGTDDCDDQCADRYPGNPEICDGKDNDCDRDAPLAEPLPVDEPWEDGIDGVPDSMEFDREKPGLVSATEMDLDNDGFIACTTTPTGEQMYHSAQSCLDAVPETGDCNDLCAATNPGAEDHCNGFPDLCSEDGEGSDEDGDGYLSCGAFSGNDELLEYVYVLAHVEAGLDVIEPGDDDDSAADDDDDSADDDDSVGDDDDSAAPSNAPAGMLQVIPLVLPRVAAPECDTQLEDQLRLLLGEKAVTRMVDEQTLLPALDYCIHARECGEGLVDECDDVYGQCTVIRLELSEGRDDATDIPTLSVECRGHHEQQITRTVWNRDRILQSRQLVAWWECFRLYRTYGCYDLIDDDAWFDPGLEPAPGGFFANYDPTDDLPTGKKPWMELSRYDPTPEQGVLAGCWEDDVVTALAQLHPPSDPLALDGTGGDCANDSEEANRGQPEGPGDLVAAFFDSDLDCRLCLDGIDNNCNGLTDCEDPACADCFVGLGGGCGTSESPCGQGGCSTGAGRAKATYNGLLMAILAVSAVFSRRRSRR